MHNAVRGKVFNVCWAQHNSSKITTDNIPIILEEIELTNCFFFVIWDFKSMHCCPSTFDACLGWYENG